MIGLHSDPSSRMGRQNWGTQQHRHDDNTKKTQKEKKKERKKGNLIYKSTSKVPSVDWGSKRT